MHEMVNSNRNVRIVLVQPRNPLNLLAASRAAANFGFDDVVVVSPHEPVWEEARAARDAGKWLRRARRVGTVLDAVEDRNWVLGTSSLSRRRIEPSRIFSLEQLGMPTAGPFARDRLALLFGSEKRGLRNQDLELCHGVIRLPTSPAAPSMNLGQAVAVCCYKLKRSFQSPRPTARSSPATASVGEIARLVEAFERILPVRKAAGERNWALAKSIGCGCGGCCCGFRSAARMWRCSWECCGTCPGSCKEA
jgi:TrmH family RNA methyltransferase